MMVVIFNVDKVRFITEYHNHVALIKNKHINWYVKDDLLVMFITSTHGSEVYRHECHHTQFSSTILSSMGRILDVYFPAEFEPPELSSQDIDDSEPSVVEVVSDDQQK
jgi:hypothetical protein